MPERAARLLFQLPRDCRVFAAISPAAQWGWQEILANKTNYLLELLIWMKTKDATKSAPKHKPKPFMPDFMQPQGESSNANSGVEAHDVDTLKYLLSRPRE